MYGLVNKAAHKFVVTGHGEQVWNEIKEKAGIDVDTFVSMEAYPDEITYKIVGAASEYLKIDAQVILEEFGKYWIEYSMVEGYSHLLELAGNTFPEFLKNLDNMHSYIAQSFTELRPPSFICKEIDENTLILEYHSERPGLASFVVGLLKGLGNKFNLEEVSVEYLGQIEGKENSHEYKVCYK